MTDARNEVAQAMGFAISKWSNVEALLGVVFEVGLNQGTGISFGIFNWVNGLNSKLGACSAVMAQNAPSNTFLALWSKTVTELEGCYRARHRIAHGVIVGDASAAHLAPFFAFLPGSPSKKPEAKLKKSDIEQRYDRFCEAENIVHWFIWTLQDRLGKYNGGAIIEPATITKWKLTLPADADIKISTSGGIKIRN